MTRLGAEGAKAKRVYQGRLLAVETRWRKLFGERPVDGLEQAQEDLPKPLLFAGAVWRQSPRRRRTAPPCGAGASIRTEAERIRAANRRASVAHAHCLRGLYARCHLPRVKSGNSTGVLPFATDTSLNAPAALHAAASYTSISGAVPSRMH